MPPESLALRRTCLTALLAGPACWLAACATPPAPVDKRAEALRALGFRPTDAGWEFSLNGKLLFESDSDTLDTESQATADRLGRQLALLGVDKMRVEGHTDNTGRPAYNHGLSLRRAQAVARALAAAGLQDATIDIAGLGQTMPVTENATPEQRLQNRRVAVVVPAQ